MEWKDGLWINESNAIPGRKWHGQSDILPVGGERIAGSLAGANELLGAE